MTFPPVTPHSLPEPIGDDLFVVYGSVQFNPVVRFTRNMAIVRDGNALTLINPVRMDAAGLAALEDLGEVQHLLRLGPMHGLDDPFYKDRYPGAVFWAFPGGTTYTEPPVEQVLEEGGALPFSSAQLFEFHGLSEREGAVLLQRQPGVLLACDGIQSYATPPHKPHTNLLARLLMPYIGFPNETLIGPAWVKMLAPDKTALKAEFERLLTLDFDQLLAAHGTFLASGAKAEVQQAVQQRFD
ncbi:MAG: hypothetical protein ACR2PZ_11080 [Pseudomonadales bacterium]